MSKYLYGACGNEGCLACLPSFVVEFDGGEEQYEVNLEITRVK